MSLVYEVPTHLQVEDALIAGLTPRQILRLAAGASLAYGVWDQLTFLPAGPRTAAAVTVAAIGLLIALVQPGGRPLDQWALAGLVFTVSPKQWRWAVREPAYETAHSPSDDDDWVEIAPPIGWRRVEGDDQAFVSNSPSAGSVWTRG